MTLASALRNYRERHGLSQRALAKKIRIPVRTLQSYEAGAMPHTKRRQKIVALLARDEAVS